MIYKKYQIKTFKADEESYGKDYFMYKIFDEKLNKWLESADAFETEEEAITDAKIWIDEEIRYPSNR